MKAESKKTISNLVNSEFHDNNQLFENQYLKTIAGLFTRPPNQVNQFLEADAELITIEKGLILAATCDAITEELDRGLYTDPFFIGWMTIVISLSDLSAVGANPLGLLLDLRLPENFPAEKLEALQQGILEACRYHSTNILGGDTNSAENLHTGSTAIGLIKDREPMMRKGCQPGDVLYASAKLGSGGGFAFSRFLGGSPFPFKPSARITEGQMLSKFASACIDTSDGFFPAVSQLMVLNSIGVNMAISFETLLEKDTADLAHAAGLPPWFFLAGPHGEFELVFTIPEEKEAPFLKEADLAGWQPVRLGTVTEHALVFNTETKKKVNTFEIANLYLRFPDPKNYIQSLFDFHKKQQL